MQIFVQIWRGNACYYESKKPESIKWFIAGQSFSLSYDLTPTPPPPFRPSCQQAQPTKQRKTEKERQHGGGRGEVWGRRQIIRSQESLVLYNSFNTLCLRNLEKKSNTVREHSWLLSALDRQKLWALEIKNCERSRPFSTEAASLSISLRRMDMISILKEECALEHDKISKLFYFSAKAGLSSLLRTLPATNFFIRAHYLGYFWDLISTNKIMTLWHPLYLGVTLYPET